MSYTVQSVSWPAIDAQIAEQDLGNDYRVFKGGFDAQKYLNKEIIITFRTVEGYLNYFVMLDAWEQYWKLESEDTFVPNFTLRLLDNYGFQIMSVNYYNIVYKTLSELEISYASNVPEFRTFSCTFNCARVELKRQLD